MGAKIYAYHLPSHPVEVGETDRVGLRGRHGGQQEGERGCLQGALRDLLALLLGGLADPLALAVGSLGGLAHDEDPDRDAG